MIIVTSFDIFSFSISNKNIPSMPWLSETTLDWPCFFHVDERHLASLHFLMHLRYGHGVLHNYGGDSFFQKDKSCVSPKLWLKSILLFYKNILEIESCLKEAVF